MSFECEVCNHTYASKQAYNRHLKSARHLTRTQETQKHYHCLCGKFYSHRQSLQKHKTVCDLAKTEETPSVRDLQDRLDMYEKEREEMKAQITMLLDKHTCTNTINNNANNIIENQTNNNNNVHIHINAFGKENTDYLDTGAIVACIDRVYKSVPAIVERIHFDPEHPENHNIKITNRKLPYASVMGDNSKWKTMNKKDVIESMVYNGYNYLDEKYCETKHALSAQRQQHFEGFQDRFMGEDKDLLKQVKNDVELLVLNGVQEHSSP